MDNEITNPKNILKELENYYYTLHDSISKDKVGTPHFKFGDKNAALKTLFNQYVWGYKTPKVKHFALIGKPEEG